MLNFLFFAFSDVCTAVGHFYFLSPSPMLNFLFFAFSDVCAAVCHFWVSFTYSITTYTDYNLIADTFAFMENRPRWRVKNDASSSYFRAPSSQQHGQSFTCGHRHRDSNISVSSQVSSFYLFITCVNKDICLYTTDAQRTCSLSIHSICWSITLCPRWETETFRRPRSSDI